MGQRTTDIGHVHPRGYLNHHHGQEKLPPDPDGQMMVLVRAAIVIRQETTLAMNITFVMNATYIVITVKKTIPTKIVNPTDSAGAAMTTISP